MFCENCGNRIPDTAVFCTKCGAKTAGAQSGGSAVQSGPSTRADSSHQANPAQVNPAQANPVQASPIQAGPVPPVARPAPDVSSVSRASKPEISAAVEQPVQSHGAMPRQPAHPPGAMPRQPAHPPGAVPRQPAHPPGAAPVGSPQSHGASPGYSGSGLAGSDIMSYGQYMVMLLLTSIPVVNIIMLIKWGFSDEVSPNKRNFARALLTFALIGLVFGIILWSSVLKSASTFY